MNSLSVKASSLISRPQLFELLDDHLSRPMILIKAPAGYGKTALVKSWLEENFYQSTWVECRYLKDVSAALEQVATGYVTSFNEAKRLTEKAEHETPMVEAMTPPESALDALPHVLVLDDFHLLTDDSLLAKITDLVHQCLPKLMIVLITRTHPSIKVARLRMLNQVLEVTENDLTFSTNEVHELLSQRLPFLVTRDLSEKLCRRVRGWPCAIQIAISVSRSSQQLEAFINGIDKGHRHINDFFEEEVIRPLSREQVRFLESISLLKQFNGELAFTITGDANARHMLYTLSRLGVFIHLVDDVGEWLELHPLFAHYLYQRLLTFEGSQYISLHQRASDAFLSLQQPKQAAMNALAAKDAQRISDILHQYGRDFYYNGEFSLLEQSYAHIPEAAVCNSPILTLLQAWVAQSQYDFEKVQRCLNKAEKNLRDQLPVVEWSSLESEISAIRAQVAMNQGDTKNALILAERALKHDHIHLHSCLLVAHSVLGEAHFVQGSLAKASAEIRRTELLARTEGVRQLVIWCLCLEAEIAIAQGALQKAWGLQEKAINFATQYELTDLPLLEFVYRIRSNVLLEWHHLEDAELFALKGLAIQENQHPRWDLQAQVILAKIALERRDLELCARYVEKIQTLLDTEEYHLDWTANGHSVMISYWIHINDLEKLSNWLAQVQPLKQNYNHFSQCHSRNVARAMIATQSYQAAQALLTDLQADAEHCGLMVELNRTHILLAQLFWCQSTAQPTEQVAPVAQDHMRAQALKYFATAIEMATSTGAITSFLKLGASLIEMVELLQAEGTLSELAIQRAHRLTALLQTQNTFHQAETMKLDESVIQDIINRPDVPELIKLSPLTRREWQVLSLIHGRLSNEQIAARLNVAPTTIKTHIRSLYQKQNISQRSEAIELAESLLQKINA